MTKNSYESLANLLKSNKDNIVDFNNFVTALMSILKQDNKNFKEDRFLLAIYKQDLLKTVSPELKVILEDTINNSLS